MVGAVDDVEACARAELLADGREQREIGESVACALEKKHRLRNAREVRGARGTGPPSGMQRKAQEHEASHCGEPTRSGGVRRDASSHRLSAREEGKTSRDALGLRCRGAHGRLQDGSRIGSLRAHRLVGELEAQRRHAGACERARDRLEEGVAHAGARAGREHEQARGVAREPEETEVRAEAVLPRDRQRVRARAGRRRRLATTSATATSAIGPTCSGSVA